MTAGGVAPNSASRPGFGAGVPMGFWLWFAGLWFCPGLVFRLFIARGLEEESLSGRLLALAAGLGNDLQALSLVLGWLGAGFLVGARFARWWLGITLAIIVIVFIADSIYWLEFNSRFDRFVLNYVQYPREVLVFLEEQFFLGLFILPFAILIWLAAWWVGHWLPERITGADRLVCCLWILLGAIVVAFGSPGVAGHSRHLHHLGNNGYLGLLTAARVDPSVWRGFYWRPEADSVVALGAAGVAEAGAVVGGVPAAEVGDGAAEAVAGDGVVEIGVGGGLAEGGVGDGVTEAGAGDWVAEVGASDRVAEAGAGPGAVSEEGNGPRSQFALGAQFRHVVLIIEESFGGDFWRKPELRAQYMPELRALAERGLSFESVYATGGFTVRGLEAILNGYPPLPGMVVTTVPGLEKLPSLPRELGRAGFRTTFVYGGWPGFTSFHDYWRRIGFDEMLSRFDFEDRGFETSWGVADEILFEKVLDEMDRLTGAFDRVMLATLTVSNHRPFDFPDGSIGYPSDERRREYVTAYADWALGEFFRRAEHHPWFGDTLFVVVSDHGPVHAGRALVPAVGYRVPLVLYSPGKLPPAVINHQGSTMSLAVTLFDLLNIKPLEPFYGRSLLRGDGPAPMELHHEVGLLARDRLTVLVRGGGVLGWRFDGATLTPAAPDFQQAAQAEALFREAHERLYGE